jgi:hypothetical protein
MALLTACQSAVRNLDEFSSIRDGFDRTVDGSWGTADGFGWDYVLTSGNHLGLSVDGSEAVATAPREGINKGNLLIGPATGANLDVAATFTVDREPRTGTPNHWQVVLRAAAPRTYYAFLLYPVPGERALTTIFTGKEGHFTELAKGKASFVAGPGERYRIEGRAVTKADGIELSMKTWPADGTGPSGWDLTKVDRRPDRILTGRAGVRLSFYFGPARMTVDDFALRRV